MPNAKQLEAQRVFIKGVLYDLEPEDRAKIEAIKDELAAKVSEYGDHGLLALALLGAELAAQSTDW